MLSVDKATGPYSQYEVDQSEKQSVSSNSSSSVSFSNLGVPEKMNEEKQKRPKRNSFRRMFGQNEKVEKEEKKVKEKKVRSSLSIFSKDKSSKNDKNEKHEKHERRDAARQRSTSSQSSNGEKRKSYIFFSDEDKDIKKDDLTPKRDNSNGSSFSFSDNDNGPERSKNKSSTHRFSWIRGSEDDHKKNLYTNHNNLSDLFIPGNETPIKSHNRSRLITGGNIVESPTSAPRPTSLVSSSNTVGSDNTDADDVYSREDEHYQADDNSITNGESNHHEHTVISDDIDDTGHLKITDESHQQEHEIINDDTNQDYTEIINKGNDTEIIGVKENDRDNSEIVDDDKSHQSDAKSTISHQGHADDDDANRQINTEGSNGYTNISIKVTKEDTESDSEDDDNRTQKIRNDTDDIHVRDHHLVSPNHHGKYNGYSTFSSPASPTSSSFPHTPLSITRPVTVNPGSDIENDYRDGEEERGVHVIEKKIVEKYPVPKIIEKRVIVTQENPQTRQKLEQLQATNDNLVSVKTQLEFKVEEQSKQIAKLSSLEQVMGRQVQLVERMEETIRRLETKVQDQKEQLDGRISEHMEDTMRQMEYKLNEKSKELDKLKTMVMDQLQPQTPPLYLSPVQVVSVNGLLPVLEEESSMTPSMEMTMTRQESQEMYSRSTLVNTLVVRPLVNNIVVSASIATSVLYAVYIRPVIGLIKVLRPGS